MKFVFTGREPQIANLDILSHMDRSLIDYRKYRKRTDVAAADSYRILFIDSSQFFSCDQIVEINAVEPPLGCMAILTYLNHCFGNKIYGEIIKTGVDVDSFEELKNYVAQFRPNLIAMRTMSYFKNFFVECVKEIRKSLVKNNVGGGMHMCLSLQADHIRPLLLKIVCATAALMLVLSAKVKLFVQTSLIAYLITGKLSLPKNV